MKHRFADLLGQLPRPDSASVPQPDLEAVNEQLQSTLRRAEKLVTQYPGACLAAATVTGVLLGWWIKRR